LNDSFYGQIEWLFGKFPKYHMKILLDFSAKVGMDDIFKPRIGNGIHKISNNNGVRVDILPHPRI
jgi:hypothetical protein